MGAVKAALSLYEMEAGCMLDKVSYVEKSFTRCRKYTQLHL